MHRVRIKDRNSDTEIRPEAFRSKHLAGPGLRASGVVGRESEGGNTSLGARELGSSTASHHPPPPAISPVKCHATHWKASSTVRWAVSKASHTLSNAAWTSAATSASPCSPGPPLGLRDRDLRPESGGSSPATEALRMATHTRTPYGLGQGLTRSGVTRRVAVKGESGRTRQHPTVPKRRHKHSLRDAAVIGGMQGVKKQVCTRKCRQYGMQASPPLTWAAT